MDPAIMVGALIGIAAAAFNIWLVFRFVVFMDLVERRLGVIAERVADLDKRVAASAVGANVRLEAVVAAIEGAPDA